MSFSSSSSSLSSVAVWASNLYTTQGFEAVGDMIFIGRVSYNAKIKSIKLTAALGAGKTADVVLLDEKEDLIATLISGTSLVAPNRTEISTVDINVSSVEKLVDNEGYQGAYTIALKLLAAITTADSAIYSEVVTIDNV